jgi:hypothetical protein
VPHARLGGGLGCLLGPRLQPHPAAGHPAAAHRRHGGAAQLAHHTRLVGVTAATSHKHRHNTPRALLLFLHKNMVQVGVVDVSVMSHVTPHRVMMIDGIDSQFFSSCCSSVVSRKKGKRTEEEETEEEERVRYCPRDRSIVYPP